ncbi:MAG: FprA family A-type flavoprotein [Methanomicrobiales archaeon]|nr:FprA family A-type flavoprotein [Methanomicrobiales archaeon]
MTYREIVPGLCWVGANDWDRRLFDELIPLPQGTSYNAYLIRGKEKTALIDTVDPRKEGVLLENLRSLGLSSIDYLVVNHAEQDHSGAIPCILEAFPGIKIVTNAKCQEFLQSHLLLADDVFYPVQDRDTLSLGDRTLEFLITPWVHWPETMLTYLQEDKILFTCDFFGSHLASSDLYARDLPRIYEASKRYYAEIMMPFRVNINTHLERLKDYEIRMIATSHGPIWDDPEFILDAYADWVSDRVKNEVMIAYVSMHGSTRAMVDYLVDALVKRGVTVKLYNLAVTDLGEMAISLVDAGTIVIGTPTVLFNPHPTALYAAHLVRILRPKARYAAVIGSYGWGGKTLRVLSDMFSGSTMKFLDPVLVKGYPTEEGFRALDRLADSIAERHRDDPLVIKDQ